MSPKWRDWLACVLCGVTTAVVVLWMGGPTWVAYGFGHLTFLMVRR